MAFSGSGPSRGIKAEINVTPLVDVVLVLLIIFMVITPMLQRGKDVNLPKAKQTEKDGKETDPLVISVTADKQLFLENDGLDEAALSARLREKLAAAPHRKILLKGDETLTFDDVRKVMHLARGAGAKAIALGVEEQK